MPVTSTARTVSRRVLLGGIGIGTVGTIIGLPGTAFATESTTGRRPTRVASFNIHHGVGTDEVLDLERIASIIEALDVDLVGLQEVDRFWARSDFVDQPAWLADRLGMDVAFGANLDMDPDEPGRPRREYGTAVLSKTRILDWTNTFLPCWDGHEQRGLLTTTVKIGGRRVTFGCTHLDYHEPAERAEQCQAIIDVLGRRPRRTFLVGDLNTEPSAPELEILTDVLDDVWVAKGEGDGFTYPAAPEPTARIDFVMASPDVAPASAEVVLIAPEASDHLPVSADYKLRGR